MKKYILLNETDCHFSSLVVVLSKQKSVLLILTQAVYFVSRSTNLIHNGMISI